MSQIEKLLKKFIDNPSKVRYVNIEKVLLFLDFEKIPTKGSHVKWKHHTLHHDIIIPVHNNECKNFYKEQVYKQTRELIKNYHEN
jgi:predicted RNA binding protein YcfA (HicA-like mRNA interferase family)